MNRASNENDDGDEEDRAFSLANDAGIELAVGTCREQATHCAKVLAPLIVASLRHAVQDLDEDPGAVAARGRKVNGWCRHWLPWRGTVCAVP